MVVFLLKNPSDDKELGRIDPYEQHIPNLHFVPILDYLPVDIAGLTALLSSQHDEVDAFIITSQRSVDSLKLCLGELQSKDLERAVLAKPVYTVGPTTAERLELLGFSSVSGSDTGNGSALAKYMGQRITSPLRFLFLAGEVHRTQLPDALKQDGHTVDTKIVYKTAARDNVVSELRNQIKDGDWIIFFSPSHINGILDMLRDVDPHGTRYKVAAIGPSTESYLKENNIQVHVIAKSPTAESLKRALDSYSS